MKSTIYKKKSPLMIFLIPAFAFLIIFLFYPFIQNIINSFLNIKGLGTAAQGVNKPWYENFVKLGREFFNYVKGPDGTVTRELGFTGHALVNTLILMVCTVVFQVGIALVLALMVDSIKLGSKLFRTVYFFPIVISATALGLMFNLIFLYNTGMLNQLLQSVFGRADLIDWKDQNHFMLTMLVPVMWQYVGFYFVILVTGLNNISPDIYEAARIDGAGGPRMVWHIKLPLLRNVLITCVVLAVTGALKVFDLPWVMFGRGIPMDKSWLTGTYMYEQAFVRGDVDYGSTIAIVIVVLGVLFANLTNKALKKADY